MYLPRTRATLAKVPPSIEHDRSFDRSSSGLTRRGTMWSTSVAETTSLHSACSPNGSRQRGSQNRGVDHSPGSTLSVCRITVVIIARIPVRTMSGRLGHAATTCFKSRGTASCNDEYSAEFFWAPS